MNIISGIQAKPLKAVIYGAEGIGKSTFAAQAPNPLFIDTEGSTARMNVRRFEAPGSYTVLCQQIDYVIQNPNVCSTLVLDTADWAERLVIDHVCAVNHWSSLESPGYGSGYRYSYEEFGRLLNRLDRVTEAGIHVIVTAHAALRKFEQPDQMGSYDRWELKLQNSGKCNIAAMLKEWADMVLFANYETFTVQNKEKKEKAQGGKRVMYTTHHPCWDAKNRFGLPEKLPFSYECVAHCFGTKSSDNSGMQPAVDSNSGRIYPEPEPKKLTPPPMPEPAGQKEPQASLVQKAREMNDGIPASLRQLMDANGVTEADIRRVVSGRGYYPEMTPIRNYDPAFIEGVLVGAWEQVHKMIMEVNAK